MMRVMFVCSIWVKHNESLRILVGHIIEASCVLLGRAVTRESMEVHHQRSRPVVVMRVVSG